MGEKSIVDNHNFLSQAEEVEEFSSSGKGEESSSKTKSSGGIICWIFGCRAEVVTSNDLVSKNIKENAWSYPIVRTWWSYGLLPNLAKGAAWGASKLFSSKAKDGKGTALNTPEGSFDESSDWKDSLSERPTDRATNSSIIRNHSLRSNFAESMIMPPSEEGNSYNETVKNLEKIITASISNLTELAQKNLTPNAQEGENFSEKPVQSSKPSINSVDGKEELTSSTGFGKLVTMIQLRMRSFDEEVIMEKHPEECSQLNIDRAKLCTALEKNKEVTEGITKLINSLEEQEKSIRTTILKEESLALKASRFANKTKENITAFTGSATKAGAVLVEKGFGLMKNAITFSSSTKQKGLLNEDLKEEQTVQLSPSSEKDNKENNLIPNNSANTGVRNTPIEESEQDKTLEEIIQKDPKMKEITSFYADLREKLNKVKNSSV